MESRSFLEALLPSEGFVVLGVLTPAGENNKKPLLFNKYHTSIESLLADAENEQSKGRDVYFTPATFETSNNRQANNAKLVKSFFLDLDVGEGPRKYASKKAAVTALGEFLEATGMPTPSLVDSGGGVHVYWLLSAPLSIKAWFPLATRLKKLCAKFNFLIDPTVTSDAARIMRLVGFENKKRSKPCVLKNWAPAVDVETIEDVLDRHVEEESWLTSAKADWMKGSALSTITDIDPDRISVFKKIAIKSLKNDDGCQQLAYTLANQKQTDEPLWRATLSIAWACDDADTAIHNASNDHPDYDYDMTVAKAMATKGPYHCATFEGLNPDGCKGCPNKGKITSPIQLGSTLRRAPMVKEKGGYEATPEGSIEVETEQTPVLIPEYPRPFFRPASGGIAIMMGEGELAEAYTITDVDFWVEQIIKDSVTGMTSLWIRSWHKFQGTNDFVMPNCINQGGEMVKHLEGNGLIFEKKSEAALRKYVYQAVRQLNNTKPNLFAVNQFGWSKNFDSFVLGDVRYKRDGSVEFSPPSSYTAPLIGMFTPRGSLAKWKAVAQPYFEETETLGAHQAAILSAFASPLFTFTGKAGLIYSMYGGSGAGKTTVQKVALAAFSEPKSMLLLTTDTFKSKMERMGVVQNMPVALEETTKMEPEQLVQMTYTITQGRSNNQANQHGGGEKVSDRTWSLIATSSSNTSLAAKLSSEEKNHTPEANLVRMLEIAVPKQGKIDYGLAQRIDDTVNGNYGHAGTEFMKYVVKNVDNIRQDIMALQDHVYLVGEYTPKDRFIVAGIACMIYAGHLLNKIKLLNVDLRAFTTFILQASKGYAQEIDTISEDRGSSLSEFVRTYARNTIEIVKSTDGKEVVKDQDRVQGPIMIRIEHPAQRIYIPSKELRAFCTKRGDNYHKVLRDLEIEGLLVNTNVNKRLMAGTAIGSSVPPTRCIELILTDDI